VKMRHKVVIAMSGGVDSSVAAALLVKKGYNVIGVSMKLWPLDLCGKEKPKSCCSTKDLNDARFVASQLGIPFYAIDLSKEFKRDVMDYFSAEYASGRTPNPCILCNEKIKFGALFKKAKKLQADFIATGHYAKIDYDRKRKRFSLKEARDKKKDQSYALFGLNQSQLPEIIFPLGGYTKKEVRGISKKLKLKTADKKESQEICFIWDNSYPEFLKSNYGVKPKPGDIVDKSGNVLGRHPGFMFFTIGQRRGLNLGGNKEPMYVTDIDAKNNRITVGYKQDLEKNTLFADGINWIDYPGVGAGRDLPLQSPLKVKAKIRYNHKAAPAVVYPVTFRPRRPEAVKVVFDKPQSAITPGQAVVFYKGDSVLGGGWIR